MKYIQGKDRNQAEFFCIEHAIEQNNEVRLIELFVSQLDLKTYGFKTEHIENGRPAYHPSDLLKLYIYGYMNRIRSSRKLETECKRNLEVIWLLKGLKPDHNTVSNFRKNNNRPIKKVFRATVELAKNFELIGGKLIAGDGTKLRAQNSKKNNFNEKKINRHIDYIDTKVEEYNNTLAQQDGDRQAVEQIKEKIDKWNKKKVEYEQMKQHLKDSEIVQISTSDPDSRQMIIRNNIAEVAYNIQSTVDDKNKIIIDHIVTNETDRKAMGSMVRRASCILKNKSFTALFDKGYHTVSEFEYADRLKINTIVAYPGVAAHAPNRRFDMEHFKYDKVKDEYLCPAGETLTTNGRYHKKQNGKTTINVKYYKTKACKSCKLILECTRNKRGRSIARPQHASLIEENKKRIEQNKELYRKRQAIVEHPFGTIKRQWDFYYIMTKKTIKHAEADVGLIFTAYNLRRIFNLIGVEELGKYLKDGAKTAASFLSGIIHFIESVLSVHNFHCSILHQKITTP